jgi:hypothetical protein
MIFETNIKKNNFKATGEAYPKTCPATDGFVD